MASTTQLGVDRTLCAQATGLRIFAARQRLPAAAAPHGFPAPAARPRACRRRAGAVRAGAGAAGWEGGHANDPRASHDAYARMNAYMLLLDPILAILACDPAAQRATKLVRAMLTTDDAAVLAASRAAELDERLFITIRKCWTMGMRVFRSIPRESRQEDQAAWDALVLLDEAWNAASEAQAAATEPEHSLLKRLITAWTEEERAQVLRPAAAVYALTSHDGLFFTLLDLEAARASAQDTFGGDAFLENQKAQRLAKLASIRCEAQQRAALDV